MRTSRCEFHKALRSLLPILFLFSFITLGLNTAPTYADSLTLSVSTNNLAVDLSPLSSTGDFNESSNMSINVSTSSTSGYTLSIASSTGSTDLTNQSDNTKKFNSISSNLTNSDFSNSSNTQYNNKWGYKPSQYVTVSGNTYTTVSNTGSSSVFKPLPGTSGEIIARTNCANGTSPCTNATDNYTISIGARANNQTAIGSYVSDTFIITAVTNKSVVSCDSSKLCVQYNGNGLPYPETTTQLPRNVNNVNYNSTTTQEQVTKYSHTPNVNDAGVQDGNYPHSANLNDVVTIDGASTLNISLKYGSESGFDWTSFWSGSHPSYTAGSDFGSGVQCAGNTTGKYMGGPSTIECSVSDSSVTFGFKSDGSDVGGGGFGYYAVITGTGTTRSRTVTSGEYAAPTGTNVIFHGWSSTQTTAGGGLPSDVEYADETAVKSNIPGDNGDTKTLYAVWQQEQTITFNKDSNVSSIAVLDSSGTTVGTITSSGQSLTLYQGNAYTLKPIHATGYTTSAITKTTGAGTISGKQFTVGAGSATISVTSRALSPIQNFNCSSLSTGSTEEVYDKRDNKVYLIGKLADNNCWMLDNLALDPTTLTQAQLYGTGADAGKMTNASNTTLGYLKNGGGSSPYTNYAVATATSTNYYDRPAINADSIDVVPNGAPSGGEGSNKVGVYYNYCAASAGSYCYASGSGTGDSSEDLCPAGWRMPTGGSSGEYKALYDQYSSASEGQAVAFKNALSTPLSGSFYNGSEYHQGSDGIFWSSPYTNGNSMYSLLVTASSVRPSDYSNRSFGGSLRCIRSGS